MFLCLFWLWRNWHKTVLASKWNNTVKINIDLLLFSCLWTLKNRGLSFFLFTDVYVVGYCDRERSLVQLVAVRTQMYGNVSLKLWAWDLCMSLHIIQTQITETAPWKAAQDPLQFLGAQPLDDSSVLW
jgi:hypothetical protein